MMNTKEMCRPVLIGFLILLTAIPAGALAQGSGTGPTFRQEELDQTLAPIALYPDSLLAQILVAATYPLQVVQADRWIKQNKNLKGDRLNDALDKMNLDLSVKALAPFPQVLSMMSEKLDWTQKLGDAFLAQQADVMDTIQKLRARAKAQGNLQTTKEQQVTVQEQTIVIEPASPTVVYVPAYNPAVIYGPCWYPPSPPYAYYPAGAVVPAGGFGFAAGVAVGAAWNHGWGYWDWSHYAPAYNAAMIHAPWWHPAYPPYPYYPAGAVVPAGGPGFDAGVAVGAAWNHGWGYWDWGHHDVNVNVNRNVNINRNINVSNIQTATWQHDVTQRGGVPYRDQATRQRYGQQGMGSPDSRRDFRGYSRDAGDRGGWDSAGQGAAGTKQRSLQKRFRSPEEAAQALAAAAKANDMKELAAVLGPEGKQLISSGDEVSDRAGRERFVRMYEEKNQVVKENDQKAVTRGGESGLAASDPHYQGRWKVAL